MSDTPVPLTTMSTDECWSLLATHEPRLGRIGFTSDGATVIYPMNYAVSQRTVYLRTDPTSGLTEALGAQEVAFEVDEVELDWERGWSVLVQGSLQVVDDPDELHQHRDLLLRAWAPGERLHLLRLDTSRISGRRIG